MLHILQLEHFYITHCPVNKCRKATVRFESFIQQVVVLHATHEFAFGHEDEHERGRSGRIECPHVARCFRFGRARLGRID